MRNIGGSSARKLGKKTLKRELPKSMNTFSTHFFGNQSDNEHFWHDAFVYSTLKLKSFAKTHPIFSFHKVKTFKIPQKGWALSISFMIKEVELGQLDSLCILNNLFFKHISKPHE